MTGSRRAHLLFFIAFALAVFLPHAPFLRLPLFWDELGQFVPAALDLYYEGAWVPHSATPNVHPPGLMAYLAAVWSMTGYSLVATRAAMLLLASVGALAAFLLAIELGREAHGAPAFSAAILLLLSPLFYTQSMLAQLDMPAMVFHTLALLLFLQNRMIWSVAACVALVLTKETGAIAPAFFCSCLLREKRVREAFLFLIPLAALAAWLFVLWRSTNHILGNAAFTDYNLLFTLHPVRMAVALARRLYFLFFEDLRWIGALAILAALAGTQLFAGRSWRVAWALVTLNVLLLSVVGGAVLERYLLPVLPIVLAAIVVALSAWRAPYRLPALALLCCGLIVGHFWNPPYPFPFENNLSLIDFVTLHATAAEYVERRYGEARIASVWPFTAEISRTEFGYVSEPLRAHELPGFAQHHLTAQQLDEAQVLVLYSRMWNPQWNWMRVPYVESLWRRLYGFEPQADSGEFERLLHMRLAAAWKRRGQWIEIWERQHEFR